MESDEFSQIRVRDLRFFDRLATLGTITAAAKDMGVPKPTASRWLAQLEQRVGHPLVRRSTRHANLTQMGASFHRRVVEILSAVNTLEHSMSGAPGGTVRVSVPVPLGRMLGGKVIAGFRRRLPAVRLEIALQNERVDLVRDRFDLAIRGGVLPDSELIAKKIGEAPLYLYASRAYANLGIDQVPLLASPGDEAMLARGTKHTPKAAVLIDDRGALADALVAGAGVGILPAFLGEPACQRGDLVRLNKTALARMPVHALYLRAQKADARVRILVEEIADVLGPTLRST